MKDCGPAFPTTYDGDNDGMSLRAYFAAMAMQGRLANGCSPAEEEWRVNIARDSWLMADTMLKFSLDKKPE